MGKESGAHVRRGMTDINRYQPRNREKSCWETSSRIAYDRAQRGAAQPPTSPVSTSPRVSPSPDDLASSPRGLEAAFAPVAEYEFSRAPRSVMNTQRQAIIASVERTGKVEAIVVRSARRTGTAPIVVTLAAIRPNEAMSTMDVFDALLRAIATTGDVEEAIGGQGLRVSGDAFTSVIAPVAVEPKLLVLIATGPPDAPVDSLAAKMVANSSRLVGEDD